MATGKESIKSKGLLFEKPNPFDWSEYKKHHHKRMRKHIMADPYGCDRCGDTYNKNDLVKIKVNRFCKSCPTPHKIHYDRMCRNCL